MIRLFRHCYLASVLAFVCFAGPLALGGAAPQISNRAPAPGEVGYRPADGASVALNPPSFIWIHETNAQTYIFQWATNREFNGAISITNLPWNTYTHSTTWTPGRYFWRYAYTTRLGVRSGWSMTRAAVVPAGATSFPMPDRRQQRASVPNQHPRLFVRPEQVQHLRQLATTSLADRFAQIRASADRFIAAGPTAEPVHRGSARDKTNKELIKYWWPNRQQTEQACIEAETIAFLALLTGEPKYTAAARRWILHLAAWDPDGPTNFQLNCEAGKPMLYRLPRAYDWAWSSLTEPERDLVRRVMVRRVTDAWKSGEVAYGTGHLSRPYNSHGNRIWHKIGEAGIACLGEVPQAEMWLDYAVNKFHACYPVWSDDDGGWHEGVSYWSGYLDKATAWLEVARLALGIDGLKKPFFAHVGDYPLYIAPPNSPNSGFGDLSFRPPGAGIGAFMDYFVRAKGSQDDGGRAGYWRWWTEQYRMKGPSGIRAFLNEASLPNPAPARPPTDLPVSKIFQGIGIASLHTTLLDSRDDVHFLFKSSPFGTQSHGHNPHNSFQLNAYGEQLLVTCVYRDLHGSKFHYGWAHSTIAHNCVLVDGQGQVKHSTAPHGRIVHAQLLPAADYVVGDATDAYGGRLERFRRHVAFVKSSPVGPLIILWDELAAAAPGAFSFMLHGLKPFEVDEAGLSLRLAQPRASVTVRYLSPVQLSIRQWDGFEPPPDKDFPNQWHVQVSTVDKQKSLNMLTVIVPARAGAESSWIAERLQDSSTLGVRVKNATGKIATVKFDLANTPGLQVQTE